MIEIQIIATDLPFFYIRIQVGKANTSLVPWFGPVVYKVEGLFMARDRMRVVTKTPPEILSRLLGIRYNNSRYNLTWLFIQVKAALPVSF